MPRHAATRGPAQKPLVTQAAAEDTMNRPDHDHGNTPWPLRINY